jgi:hypothetical protein
MDVSNPTAAVAAPAAVDPGAASRGAPDYAERLDRFKALSSTVLDTSGKVSEADQLDAYKAITRMKVTGQMLGMEEMRATLHVVDFESAIGQKAQALQKSHMASVMAAAQSGGAAGAIRAALADIDGLSKADQNVLFGSLKGPDRTGASEHASVEAWRDNLDAQLQLVNSLRPNGQFDPGLAEKGDPKFDQALALSRVKSNTSADWTAAVLKLFESDPNLDRVDLSPSARTVVGDIEEPSKAQTYRPGSVASSVA